jgi:hypothetical protein
MGTNLNNIYLNIYTKFEKTNWKDDEIMLINDVTKLFYI